MLHINSVRGPVPPAVPSCLHFQSGSARKYLATAISHPKQLVYRSPSSSFSSPSLGRGWIIEPGDHRCKEVLIVKPQEDLSETSRRKTTNGNIPQLNHLSTIPIESDHGEVLLVKPQEDYSETSQFESDNLYQIIPVENDQGLENSTPARGSEVHPLFQKPKYVRGADIDKTSFLRVYYPSALRVPAKYSSQLASELREYLLNWPRVNNVARVEGDDIDEDVASLLTKSEEQRVNPSSYLVKAAVYGAPEINPAKRKQTNREGSKRQFLNQEKIFQSKSQFSTEESFPASVIRPPQPSMHKSAPITLELVTGEFESERGENGPPRSFNVQEPCKSEKWAGPTRLLLLGELYWGSQVSELPIPIQVVYSRFQDQVDKNMVALVTCRMTLSYEYWSMTEVLRELLPSNHTPVTFERTGHIARLNLQSELHQFRHLIAQVILDKFKPEVRSVVVTREIMYGEDYVVQLEILAGSSSLVTTVWECNIPFRLDMAHMAYDSRLRWERECLVRMFSAKDVVCDVCAGVGLVAIPAGKIVRRVFANNLNIFAHVYLAKNVVNNQVASNVEIFNDDMATFLRKMFDVESPLPITQLIISHPSAGMDFLEFLVGAFNRKVLSVDVLPCIHLDCILEANNPEDELCMQIERVLGGSTYIRIIRLVQISLGKWLLRASFVLPAHVGFGDDMEAL